MTQCERLLAYLQRFGRIDPLQAWQELGIYRLGARVFDLKAAGHDIKKNTKVVSNRYGEDCHVAEYYLEQGEQKQ